MNVPVDVTDPRMQFRGSWGSDPNDPDRPSYHNQTFQATAQDGDAVVMDWVGGDVTVVGNAKANHGFYSVSLDSGPKQYFNGYSPSLRTRVVLWTSTGLSGAGPHRVEVRNENAYMRSAETQDRVWLDIDYMAFIAPPQQSEQPPVQAPATSQPAPAPSSAQTQVAQQTTAATGTVQPQPYTSASSSSGGSSTSAAANGSASATGTGTAISSSATSIVAGNTSAIDTIIPGAFTAGPAPSTTGQEQESFPFLIQPQAIMTTGTPRLAVRLPGPDTKPYTSASGIRAPIPFLALMLYNTTLDTSAASLADSRTDPCPAADRRIDGSGMPLPVERSQGSVFSLVARFQTAADHNAANAERERSRDTSRRSSSASTGSAVSLAGPNGNGVRVVSGTGTGAPWKKAAEPNVAVPGEDSGGKKDPTAGPSGDTANALEEDGDGMEVLKGDEDVKAVEHRLKAVDLLDSAFAPDQVETQKATATTTSASPKKPVNSEKTTAKDAHPNHASSPRSTASPTFPKSSKILSPARPPPSPRTNNKVAAAPTASASSNRATVSASATKANVIAAAPTSPGNSTTRARTISKSSSGSAAVPKAPMSTAASGQRGGSAAVNGAGVGAKVAARSPNGDEKAAGLGTSRTAGAKATTVDGAKLKSVAERPIASISTTTTPGPASKGEPKSKVAVSPLAPKSPTVRSTAAPKTAAQGPISTPTTAKPSVTSPSSRPAPSAFKPAKPLTPSMTGPAGSASRQRPTSVLGSNGHSPLRPQLTGTPSKPTASSLAKARAREQDHPALSPSTPSGTGTASVGRASGKRLSMGLGSTPIPANARSAQASTQSPVQSRAAEGAGASGSKEDTAKKRISGSSSMSRLMQGTAASRAKAADRPIHHHHNPSQSPAKIASPVKKKAGEAAKASATQLEAKRPRPADQPVGAFAPGMDSSPTKGKPDDSLPQPKVEHAGLLETPVDIASLARDGPSDNAGDTCTQAIPDDLTSTSAEKAGTTDNAQSSSTLISTALERTEAVGDSPIGRIGLAAKHVPDHDATEMKPDDIGLNPTVAAVPTSSKGDDTDREKKDAE